MSKKRLLSNTAISSVFLFGLGQISYAADPYVPQQDTTLPAVSATNFKIAPYVGYQDDEVGDGGIFGLLGSLAVPLGHSFGAEISGQVAGVDGDLFGRAEGHLFWRNPATGLFGVYGSIEGFDDPDQSGYRLAVEGEYYLDRVTLSGRLGYEDLDTAAGGVDGVYAVANLHYYVNDDFRLTGGYRHMYDMNMGEIGVEYQLANSWFGSGTSLFARGNFSDDDYGAVWGGIRMYFGAEDKSLIRRHREDNPFTDDQTPRFDDDCRDDKDDKNDKCRGRSQGS